MSFPHRNEGALPRSLRHHLHHCLNGDKYKTGKKTPEGKPDPSVFSTAKSPVGIQVGTAIALMERLPETSPEPAQIRFRHWWGKTKPADLLASLEKKAAFENLKPALGLGLPFMPVGVSEDYQKWHSLPDLMPISCAGVKTSRDEALVSIDRKDLETRLEKYFNPSLPLTALAGRLKPLATKSGRFDPIKVREELLIEGIGGGKFLRYLYRPFDLRWVYWHPKTKLLDEKRPDYVRNVTVGNFWIEARKSESRDKWDRGTVTNVLADNFANGLSNFFPLYLAGTDKAPATPHPDLFAAELPVGPQPNLSEFAREYLIRLGGQSEELFFHIVAILHSPAYRQENAGALRQDWPRVPPEDIKTLRAGAKLGRRIAALLDPETPVPNVTDLNPAPNLKGLAELTVYKKAVPDLALTAGWGRTQKTVTGEITMPGSGKTTPGTRGEGYLDIHLNATTRWKDIPTETWQYTLGGYQVLKKWLNYREQSILHRPLTQQEIEQFTHHSRRVTALLAENGALDKHYQLSTQNL